jgi:RecA/RadA recombinase
MPSRSGSKQENKVQGTEKLALAKDLAFQGAMASINKTFGEATIIQLGTAKPRPPRGAFSTGCLSLDLMLNGGFPREMVTELYGPEGGGKSTLGLTTIGIAQNDGENAALVDAEHGFDPNYARKLGVNVEKLAISQPESGEEALQIVETLVDSGAVGIIVVDSVAMLVPRAEIEGEIGDSVPFDAPIIIKQNGILDIVPIEDLYGGWKKFTKGNTVNKYTRTKGKTREGLFVLTASGWKKILCVYYKKNVKKKPIILTKGNSCCAQTTPDHCLFVGGISTKPTEVRTGCKLDINPPEKSNFRSPVTPEIAWLLGFFTADGHMGPDNFVTLSGCKRELIENAQLIAKSLCLSTKIRTRIYPKGNPRKPLHLLACSTRKEVGALFSLCYSRNSRLKKVPDIILNAVPSLKRSFLDGFRAGDGSFTKHNKERFSTSSFILAAGIHYLKYCLNETMYLATTARRDGFPEFTVGTNDSESKRYADNEVQKLYDRPGPTPEFLYDISTEDGTFVGGIGFVVHHNSNVALLPRLMAQALRRLTKKVARNNVALIFINQLRENINQFGYGEKTTTPGGRALKHNASLRLHVGRIAGLKVGEKVVGARVRAKDPKSRVCNPYQEVEFDLIYGVGIDREADVLDQAVKMKIVTKDGAWYNFGDERIGNGRLKTCNVLRSNRELFSAIRGLVVEQTANGASTEPEEQGEPVDQ